MRKRVAHHPDAFKNFERKGKGREASRRVHRIERFTDWSPLYISMDRSDTVLGKCCVKSTSVVNFG